MPSPKGINLLPEIEAKKAKTNIYVSWFFHTGIMFLLITYVLVIGAFAYRWYREQSLDQVNQQIKTKAAQVENKYVVTDDYQKLQDKYSFIDQAISQTTPIIPYFIMLEETIPVPISIDELQINTTSMQILINGLTSEYQAISQWENDLSEREEIESIQLSSVERVRGDFSGSQVLEAVLGDMIQFSFEITIKK